MEPRPQRPRPPVGQGAPSPQQPNAPGSGLQRPGPGDYPEGVDPTTFIAPSRTEYDYSPLDLAPPGQRRRRQFVAAAIGGFSVLLLGALAIFGYLILRDEEPSGTNDDVIAAQTEVAQSRATIAAQETVVAQAAADQTAVAGGDSTAPAGTPSAAPTAASGAPPTDAAAQPTTPPDGATTGQPTAPAAGAADTSGALDQEQLTALLPDVAAAPAGLDTPTDTQRDLATVVGALGGGRLAETNLTTWGWTGNVERSFNASDPAVIEAGATAFLSVSVHGFATPQAASEALPFFSDILVEGGYQELDAPQLGDSARLLQIQNEDGTTNIALYVQDGTVLYRVGASSTGGDPTTDAVNVMTTILEANPTP